MAETLDELTYDYEEEGRLVRREVAREVLSKGAWATVMYLFQELDRKTEDWRAPKVAIVRYKKWNGVYRRQSSFNVSSEKQARALMATMERWYAPDGPAAAATSAAGEDASPEAASDEE